MLRSTINRKTEYYGKYIVKQDGIDQQVINYMSEIETELKEYPTIAELKNGEHIEITFNENPFGD